MAAEIEKLFHVLTDTGTTYRIRPNPDAPSGDDAGLVLEWRDDLDSGWRGYFFIAPEAVELVAKAMLELKKGHEGNGD